MARETLKITDGNAAGQDIGLDRDLVIGRSTPGSGSLGGDPEISPEHARVFRDPSGRLMIQDLDSTNGTFVNGERIVGDRPLTPGDQVRVGRTTMSVEGGARGATTAGDAIPAPEAQTQALPPRRSGGGPDRNLLIAVGAVLLVALVVAGLAIGGVFGGGDGGKKTDTTAQSTAAARNSPTAATPQPPSTGTQPSQPSGGGYPPGFRKKFVDACASGGAPRNICGCTYDKLKARYSFAEFVSLLGKVKGSTLPAPVRDAVQECANS